MQMIKYFGTSLTVAGHYFWELDGVDMRRSKIYFGDLPFNPEDLVPVTRTKGEIETFRFEGGYAVLAIAGSCKDTRLGTKSVFWLIGDYSDAMLKKRIQGCPAAMKIINQMPFEVKW